MTSRCYTYIFFGKVLPERADVHIPPQIAEVTDLNGKKIGEMNTSIIASQITVQVTLTQNFENEILSLKNDIEEAIRVQVDLLGYTNSCGYDIEITQVTDLLGNFRVFGVNIDDPNKFPLKRPKKFFEIWPLFSTKQGDYLRLCLSDLREAIRNPKDTGFFCYRSIECVKQYFVDAYKLNNQDDKDRKKSWDIFRGELDIEREKIDFIKEYADPVRHGGKKSYSAAEGKKMLEITWEIIDKYIVYACNGYKKSK
jgi:hypothetical protein